MHALWNVYQDKAHVYLTETGTSTVDANLLMLEHIANAVSNIKYNSVGGRREGLEVGDVIY